MATMDFNVWFGFAKWYKRWNSQPPWLLANTYHGRGYKDTGTDGFWCLCVNYGATFVPKSTTGEPNVSSDARNTPTRRSWWQPLSDLRAWWCPGRHRGWRVEGHSCCKCQKGKAQLIIGADFLAAHNCDLSLRQSSLLSGNKKYSAITPS